LGCPVIIMTVAVDAGLSAAASRIANTRVLAKPADVGELLEQVRALVSDPQLMTGG